ncbi:uncharacterized protein BDCG_17600 [Blastomyces dermatitidis ER-3]|uniref:Uncharacterized protein n=2 Tax=Blastomyces TaxID=229219 RepID=A0A179UHJ5_BLAGS|nr:uncharacterized protein BDBG_16795 [Blastomyces gilchristii SLH14081]XP_045282231.1 uncharacterized protein BDCG_17600 [Blastomyces dermatitidis ER-3]OAT02504.1 hypothetical protein BDCG_17600 [Blastomyces dermatitidis ER-3]OAT07223.1 hypothetical protein BDBG_16795 [Blastomyces gilchristii SLH14081]
MEITAQNEPENMSSANTLAPAITEHPAETKMASQSRKVSQDLDCVNMLNTFHRHWYGYGRRHHIAHTQGCQSHASVRSASRHEVNAAADEEDSVDNNHSLAGSEGGWSSKIECHESTKRRVG